MKKSLFVLLAAAVLAGCTSTVSKNVRADGSVGELVWPSQKDSWRDEALRLPSPTIAAVKVGLERKNVFALLDVPHFREINGAREWNYILQRPEYTRENQAVCHLKLIYGDDDRIAAMYWLPEDCATVYGEPAAPYRLAADALFGRIGQKRSYLGGPCVYRTKKELSIVRHGEIILYKLDFILSFHPVMTPQFAL